ncbi:zinc finger MYM-type protein 4, partial [Clarias magur]
MHERQEDGKVIETDKKDHQITHEEGEEEKPENELKEEDMASVHENCGQEWNEHEEVAEEKLEKVQQVTSDLSLQLDPDGDVNEEGAEDEHIQVELEEDRTLYGNIKDNMKIEEKEVDDENMDMVEHLVVKESLEEMNNITEEMEHESAGQYEDLKVTQVKEEDGFVGTVMLEVESMQDVSSDGLATGVGETEEVMHVDEPKDLEPIVNIENHTDQSWGKDSPAHTLPEHSVHLEMEAEKKLEPPTSGSPLLKIKDEPVDEEYERALDPQAPAEKIKDEPDTSEQDFGQKTSEQIKISAVFSVGGSSTALGSPAVPPAATVPPVAPAATVPSSTSVPLPLLSSGTSLYVMCSGCKKILLKGQTAFQRKGSPQLYCSPRCLCSSTVTDSVPLPVAKKTCYYCLKVIPSPKDLILAPVDSTKAVKDFCSQKCLSTFNSKRESASSALTAKCGMCQKAGTIRHEVNFMGNIHKLCGDDCFQQFRSSNKLSVNCCITCGSYCYSDGKSPSLLVDGTVKKFCSHSCVSHFKKGKMYVFCGKTCIDDFRRTHYIISQCVYCKIEKVVKEVKRINYLDCSFCSE